MDGNAPSASQCDSEWGPMRDRKGRFVFPLLVRQKRLGVGGILDRCDTALILFESRALLYFRCQLVIEDVVIKVPCAKNGFFLPQRMNKEATYRFLRGRKKGEQKREGCELCGPEDILVFLCSFLRSLDVKAATVLVHGCTMKPD